MTERSEVREGDRVSIRRGEIGRSGIEVSSYCLGTWMFGGTGNSDPAACRAMIGMALDSGINFIDTADVYSDGDAEKIVGSAICDRRHEVVLSSKVGYPLKGQQGTGGLSTKWIARSLEASLRRLKTDYLDLYFLHRPDPTVPIEETLGVLDDLVRSGKVRAVGSSTFPAWQVAEMHWLSKATGRTQPACEQPPYSILVREAERDVFPAAQRYDIGIMAWGPLAGGWLAGRYRRGVSPPPGSRASRAGAFGEENPRIAQRYDLMEPANSSKFEVVDKLRAVAREAGISISSLALAFTQAHPAVTSTIIGARTTAQLAETLQSIDLRLDDATLDRIDAIVPPGTVLNDADRGWDPPWMRADQRRRISAD